MIIRNVIYNSEPIFFHASGLLEFNPLWGEVYTLTNTLPQQLMPDDLTIITFNNQGTGHNSKSLGVFENSLKGLPVHVLGNEIVNWKNSIKIHLLKNFLDKVTTNYVLISDSSDVVLSKNIKSLLPKFLESKAKALFNAEKTQWPINSPDETTSKEIFPYLNAGLWVAETKFAIQILDYCANLNLKSNSEQIYYKYAYKKLYPYLNIDSTCQIFQNLNRVNYRELSISPAKNNKLGDKIF